MGKHKIDVTAIIMSLIACIFLLTVGSPVWNKIVSIAIPLLFVYNLLPYIVRLIVKENEKT